MKKYTLWFVAVIASVSSVAQAKDYGVAGCGLGSILMGKEGSQVLAATTNGSTYTQFFGISSGTSNCTDEGTTKTSMQVPLFIESNRAALAKDVARGSGETIANLSEVMGCKNTAHFATTLQKNYRVIFPNEKVETAQITDSIKTIVKQDGALAANCTI